ncbi:MAG: porin, partial [Rhizobiales bacterium]|nr:porin [Hyphomicrobiales bacterium]
MKSLLLGSAAGLVAVAGAQAADLPLKAKPAEYVKVCSVYGAGFYYIPGTDTCIKLGGFVRAEYGFNANAGSHSPPINGTLGTDTRNSAQYTTRVRSAVTVDARTQTEYGTLRSYIQGGWELNSGDANYRGTIFFYRGFVQFAGFTFGKTQSFFAFYSNALNYTTEVGGGYSDAGLNVIAYTAQFGGGFSASISAEDAAQTRGGLYDASAGGTQLVVSGLPTAGTGAGSGDYAGTRFPDIVANLRVDQPWGSAQLSGAVHDVYASYVGANVNTNPGGGSATGWAVQGGVKFNLPWAQGDSLWIQGTWARGAANYLGFNPYVHFSGQIAMYGGSPAAGCGPAGAGSCGNVGLAWGLDGVFNGTNGVQLTEGWSVNAAVEHYWTPALRTSLFGHYTVLDFPGAAGNLASARGAFCAGALTGSVAALPGANCDPSFSVMQIGLRTIWQPVRNLDLGVE